MKKITIFLVALLLGVGMLAPNLWATAYDPTGVPGVYPSPPATAMINNHGMTGDALFGEFYRARSIIGDDTFNDTNLATYVSIENQSGRWVACHVRLRSGRFSVEVIDFPILLSPRDVFWFQFYTLVDSSTGQLAVQIVSTDVDTIIKSGLNTLDSRLAQVSWDGQVLIMDLQPLLLQEYNMSADFQTLEELTQGYVEVYGLWSLSFPSNFGPRTGHNFYNIMAELMNDDLGSNVQPTGFASYAISDERQFATRIPALDVGKFLSGHVFIGDFTNGIYMGYTMKALKDWRAGVGNVLGDFLDPLAAHRDFYIRGPLNNSGVPVNPATILYNYPLDLAYSEPDWATSFGPTWQDGDNWFGDPELCFTDAGDFTLPEVCSFALDEVDDAIFKSNLSSTYFNSGFSGLTYSMAAVSFPTKYLHYFFNKGSGLPATGFSNNSWPGCYSGNCAGATATRRQINPASTIGSIGTAAAIWNLEERGPRDISPFINLLLPYEVNFLPIGHSSAVNLAGWGFLVETDNGNLDVDASVFPAGHFRLTGFEIVGGAGGLDPRFGYDEAFLDALFAAPYLLDPFGFFTIGVSAQMMDFEFTNFSHARMFDPSWDNPSFYEVPTEVLPWGGGTGYGGGS